MTEPTLQILIPTIKKNHEEMIKLFLDNNINCSAIIRSQCGRNSIREQTVNGYTIKTIEADDIGVSVNRNELIKNATADYIMILDDDFVLKDRAAREIQARIFLCKEVGVVPIDNIYDKNSILRKYYLKYSDLRGKVIGYFVFNRAWLVESNLKFLEYIGPGTSIYFGEDSILIRKLFKIVKSVPLLTDKFFISLKANDRPSTWFEGYTKRYFFSQGVVYRIMHPCLYPLYYIRSAYKKRKEHKGDKKFSALNMLFQGGHELKKAKKLGRHPTYGDFLKLREKDFSKSKLLLITHQCLSKESSNGRTLLNLISSFDKDQIINFYISSEAPNGRYASSYFRVTDKEILKSPFLFKIGKEIEPLESENSLVGNKGNKKNIFKQLIRDSLWSMARSPYKRLDAWIQKEKPNCIILLASDLPFMGKLAAKLSKKYKLPIVVFNAEEYLLKKHDFLNKKRKTNANLIYKIYKRKLEKAYWPLFENYPVVHLTENLLKEHNDVYFNSKAIWICNSASTCPVSRQVDTIKNLYYFGNLGLGRAKQLQLIFEAAKAIKPDIRMFVYGKGSEEEINLLKDAGIKYEGFTDYSKLIEEIRKNADLLVHCESDDPYYLLDTRNAFSTKIPDMLGLGLPCLFYGAKSFYFIQYLKDNNAKYVATSFDELKTLLEFILNNDEQFDMSNNIALAQKNHNLKTNSDKFEAVVKKAVIGK